MHNNTLRSVVFFYYLINEYIKISRKRWRWHSFVYKGKFPCCCFLRAYKLLQQVSIVLVWDFDDNMHYRTVFMI